MAESEARRAPVTTVTGLAVAAVRTLCSER